MAVDAIYDHEGLAIDYRPTVDSAAGLVVVQDNLIGILRLPVEANRLGSLNIGGVFNVLKDTSTAHVAGVNLFWDETARIVTETQGSNKFMGKSTEAATAAAERIKVSLSGGFGGSVSGTFVDNSNNDSKIFRNFQNDLILQVDTRHTGVVAGNFHGGGTGNKCIAGLPGYEGVAIGSFPVVDLDTEHRIPPTKLSTAEVQAPFPGTSPNPWDIAGTDGSAAGLNRVRLGVSINAFLDLAGDGTGDGEVMVITNTLNSQVDKYGFTGSQASLTDFDINAFAVTGAGQFDLDNEFFIVGNLSTYTGEDGSFGRVFPVAWPSNPISLDVLLNGGTMHTGAEFTGGFPNAALVLVNPISQTGDEIIDGGLPAGIRIPAIEFQLGGSGNADRVVTAITDMIMGGITII